MGVTGNTELLATKNAIITSMVQKELAFAAKLLPTVTDVSSFAGKGMKSISFPKFDGFTVENRASGVAATKQNLTATADLLPLDRRATVSWLIDSMDELQSSVDVQAEYIKRAASAHGRDVDNQIVAALEAGAGYNQGAATTVTAAILLDMREYLIEHFADMNQVVIVMGADQEKAMLQIADFVRADYYGTSNIPSGAIGKVYGIPVIVRAGLAASKVYMYEKSGLAIGFQRGALYAEQDANEYGVGSKLAIVDQLYGVKVLQDNALSVGAGLSPLITKM